MQQPQPVTLQTPNIDIVDTKTLQQATSILSKLNKQLDALQAEKEKVTKPLNEALKAERQRFKPFEDQLTAQITILKTKLTTYSTKQEQHKREQEAKILNNKKQTPQEKIASLSLLSPNVTKSSTTDGSITFTTTTKYLLKDHQKLSQEQSEAFLLIDTPRLKEYIKSHDNKIPPGIEAVEEKSLRNFRK